MKNPREVLLREREMESNIDDVEYDGIVFERVEELLDCTTDDLLFELYDDLVFYADGNEDTVIKSIIDEDLKLSSFDYYLFDGWCIALWRY